MSELLSADDVTILRTEVKDALPDRASLQKQTATPNEWGGTTDTYATVESNVPCLVKQLSVTELAALRVEADVVASVVLPGDLTIRGTDRLIIAGTTYEVSQVSQAESWGVTKDVLVEVVG